MENNNEFLSFSDFLKKYHPGFEINSANAGTIQDIGLWASRSPNFNDRGSGKHIDKGLCILGNVGTGKTELFLVLNRYLNYLRSPYVFTGQVVWKFATSFTEDGYSCFNKVLNEYKNVYFDELALVDEGTNAPVREYVNHFGSKVLIGQELIMQMYNKFKETGYQSHFSTNTSFDEIARVYGHRAFSRLCEMCNFLVLIGEDRRMNVLPTFKNNLNSPKPPRYSAPDIEAENDTKSAIDEIYQHYVKSGELPKHSTLLYNSLVSFGVSVCTEEEMNEYMDVVAPGYRSEISMVRSTPSEIEKNKKTYIWDKSREIALTRYFELLKSKNAKTIFGLVEVDISGLIKNIIPNESNNL